MKTKGPSRRVSRNKAVLETLREIDALSDELLVGTIESRGRDIRRKLGAFRKVQRTTSITKPEKKKTKVPLPRSYIEQRQVARDSASKVSGRSRITAKFVQRGAPGSGMR